MLTSVWCTRYRTVSAKFGWVMSGIPALDPYFDSTVPFSGHPIFSFHTLSPAVSKGKVFLGPMVSGERARCALLVSSDLVPTNTRTRTDYKLLLPLPFLPL